MTHQPMPGLIRFVASASGFVRPPTPLQLVVWLPALCRKMDIPYCIVKGKARLGAVVHKKTATCLAVTDVPKSESASFAKIVEAVRANYNAKFDETRRTWGGGLVGEKTKIKVERAEKARQRELAARGL